MCFCHLLQFGTEAREFFESLRPHQKHEEAPGLAAKYSNRADEELLGLVQKMVVLDPDSRLSAAELLREPVFASLRNHSRSSKDQQRLIADLVSESLEILKVRMRNWTTEPAYGNGSSSLQGELMHMMPLRPRSKQQNSSVIAALLLPRFTSCGFVFHITHCRIAGVPHQSMRLMQLPLMATVLTAIMAFPHAACLNAAQGSKDRGTNRDRMYAEILKSYEHPGRR